MVDAKTKKGENTDVDNLSTLQLRQAVDEVEETQKRKLNLIIHGLMDSDNDKENLVEFVNKYHENLARPLTTQDIETAVRVGKHPPAGNKPRLLKVRFFSAFIRREVLTKHRKKRQSNIDLHQAQELTQAQTLEDKKLRDLWLAIEEKTNG